MTTLPARLCFVLLAVSAVMLTACNDDDEPAATPTESAVTTPAPSDTPPAATETPAPELIDPCTLRDSLEGQPLVDGAWFVLEETLGWQLCIGGAAVGSSEKYLFGTPDGGVTWTLLSMTTLGNPPAVPGVGELPNGNAAEELYFIDADNGWMGLSSPGVNLFGTTDGGVNWAAADDLPPGLPVTDIEFSDAENGVATTPEGDWTTSDGGATWEPAP